MDKVRMRCDAKCDADRDLCRGSIPIPGWVVWCGVVRFGAMSSSTLEFWGFRC
jgi:hypothetical protein